MAADHEQLTDDQAAVYDRQLRVWGLEVQNRLTAAKILIAGGCGLSAEVAKNIVLAGVGHVAIADDTPCSSAPFGNFLVAADADPSSSVAEASARTLQAMNPLVSVVSVPGSAKALAKECSSPNEVSSLAPYDLILATDLTFTEALQLDAKCTEMGKKLFVSTVNGPISFTWVNLQKHTYTVKQSADAGAKATPPVEQLADYSSLAAALSTPHASLTKRTHPLYSAIKVVAEFEKTSGRYPSAEDLPAVKAAGATLSGGVYPPRDNLLEALLSDRMEFAPVASMIGGMLANNIIRAVSGVGAPAKNFALYSLLDSDTFSGNIIIEDMPLAKN